MFNLLWYFKKLKEAVVKPSADNEEEYKRKYQVLFRLSQSLAKQNKELDRQNVVLEDIIKNYRDKLKNCQAKYKVTEDNKNV